MVLSDDVVSLHILKNIFKKVQEFVRVELTSIPTTTGFSLTERTLFYIGPRTINSAGFLKSFVDYFLLLK